MYKFLLLILVVFCSGCGMFGPRELSDKEFIKAVNKAGCQLGTVTRDDGKIDSITCQGVTRYLR